MSDDFVFNKQLSYYSPHNKSTLSRLESILGADQKFAPKRELADCLLALLRHDISLGPIIDRIREEYRSAIEDVLNPASGPVPQSLGAVLKNPVKGQIQLYPLLAFLLEPANEKFKEQILSLKSLILTAVLLLPPKKYIDIANQIRLALTRPLLPIKTIGEIPTQVHFKELKTVLDSLEKIMEGGNEARETLLASDLSSVIKDIQQAYTDSLLTLNEVIDEISPSEESTNTRNTESNEQDRRLEKSSDKEASKEWIGNYQRLTPNDYRIYLPSERQGLVNFINQGMQSGDSSRRNSSAIILMSYSIGQDIDSVLDLVYGDDGALNLNGEYCRHLKLPEHAFVPKEDIAQLRPRAEIIKLPLPPSLMEWLATLPNMNDKLAECIGTPKNDLKDNVKKLLRELRRSASLKRIHQYKTSAALQLELTLLYQDESLTHILASSENQAPPTSSFYICHEVSFLQHAYAKAMKSLLAQSALEEEYEAHVTTYAFDNSALISGIYPNSELIAALPSNARARLDACKVRGDFFDIHNAYIDYCLGLLMMATGHRPVLDPFPKLDHIDLKNNLIIISDKATSSECEWRLAALPNGAVKQIQYYLQYLRALPSKLHLDGFTTLANQIATFCSGSQDILPLFFYLRRDGDTQIQRITQKRLKERWQGIWTLPPNFTRHIHATELRKSTGSGEIVKMQIGHNYHHLHHFGTCSTIPPITFFKSVSRYLDQILEANNWQAIKSPIRATSPFSCVGPIKSYSPWKFGYKKREKDRRNKYQNAVKIIREVSEQLFDKSNIANLSAAEVNALSLFIKQDDGPFQKKRLKALQLLIRAGSISECSLDDKHATKVRKIEQSPFQESSTREYLKAQHVRENWFRYLNAPRERVKVNYELRLAEITFSAALSGGLHDATLLENLSEAIPHVLFNVSEMVLIDFSSYSATKHPSRIWFADKLSAGLILSLCRITKGKFRRPNKNKYLASLDFLLQIMIPDVARDEVSPFKYLVTLGQSLAKFELPGFLRDYASNTYKSASLPLTALLRKEQNMVLGVQSGTIEKDGLDNKYWVPPLGNSTGSKGVKELKKRLSGHKKTIECLEEDARKTKNNRCKQKLYDLLTSDFNDEPSWRFDSSLIAGYAMYLCIEGTLKKTDCAYRTVVEYTGIVVRMFVRCSHDIDSSRKSPSEFNWKSMYAEALENTSYTQRAKVCTVLYQFHRFLRLKHGFNEIDWAPIYEDMGGDVNDIAIDANFVSLAEYLQLLDMLLRIESINEFKRTQIAIIAMFGYRFGVRISETHGALSRDIINDEIISLIIKQNYIRSLKSDAARRCISLDDKLTDIEQTLLQRYFSYTQYNLRLDHLAPFFMSSDGGAREVISKAEARNVIHALLKNITGDSSLHYHQFRHSKVSLSVETRLKPPTYNFDEFDKTVLNRNFYPLHEIAVGVGHASDITTLRSYTHCLDKLILKWLPTCEMSLNDRGTAYVLLIEYGTVRKRRLLNKSKSILSVDTNQQLLRLLPIPDVNLIKSNVDDLVERHGQDSVSLSLMQFTQLLFRYSETTMSIVDFLNSRCEPGLKIQSIVESLCEFEQEFGFDHFKINTRLNKISADIEAHSPIAIMATEIKGATKALKTISKRRLFENRYDNGLASDIKIWIRTFHPRTHSNLVNNQDEYYRLMMLMMNCFDSPAVVLNFESQSSVFSTETLSKAQVTIDYKKLPRAIERIQFLQCKPAQLKIKPVRTRNMCLISIFIIGSYARLIDKEANSKKKSDIAVRLIHL